MKISDALNETINNLKNAGIESAAIDARVLLAYILKIDKIKLITNNQKLLSSKDISKLQKTVKRRITGEPVAYITGIKEFYSIDFKVTKDVLIPRPETELLVDMAIFYAKKDASVLDVGTGSGAIAIAFKKHRPDCIVYACDISEKALNVAKENAKKISGCNDIIFCKSNLFQSYKSKKFDLILANPPYVDIEQKQNLQKEVLFEPEKALFSKDHGKEIIKKIISKAEKYLNKDGILILEIGYDQGHFTKITGKEFNYSVSILKDYSDFPRLAILQKII